MSGEDYVNNPLWPILVDTVHSLVLYPHHKAYVERVLLLERPDITPRDLATVMGIALGEAMVLLYELRQQGKRPRPQARA